MRKSGLARRFTLALMIIYLYICSVSVYAANEPMKLSRFEGTVSIVSPSNKPQKAVENMVIPSGYCVVTNLSSYAWVKLDDSKLVKMDALSKIKISNEGSDLSVDIESGKLLLDVSKQIKENGSLTIRTGNTIFNVKGASAEIGVIDGQTQVLCLEGKVEGFAVDENTGRNIHIEVPAGKIVGIESTEAGLDIESNPATKEDISGFAKLQIAQNPELSSRIVAAIGEEIGKIDVKEAKASLQLDSSKQFEDIEAKASAANVDKQSMINSLLGVDSVENVFSDTESDSESEDSYDEASSEDSSVEEEIHFHEWEYVETQKEPTCTEQGSQLYKCKSCSQTKTESIAVAAHDFVEAEVLEEPTCTVEGSQLYKCKNCSQTKTEAIAIIPHSFWGEPETRVVEGENAYNCMDIKVGEYGICSVCGEVEISRGNRYTSHELVEIVEEYIPPTCTENEKVTYRCVNELCEAMNGQCTYRETREVSDTMLPHEWVANQDSTYCKENVCSSCGKIECIEHTPDADIDLEAEYEETQIVHCVNEGCEKVAECVHNEETDKYKFTGKWVEAPEETE